MRIRLIRHGMTALGAERRYQGSLDTPLSDIGRKTLRTQDDAARVYHSPLLRASETAQLLFPGAEKIAVSDLREMDFGAFEGHGWWEMEQDADYRAWVDGGCVGRCPGGESRAEFVARSNAALTSLLVQASQRGEERVIVVAHGGTIMAALSELCDEVPSDGDRYFGWHVGCCEGYKADVYLVGGTVRLSRPARFTRLAP